MTKIAIIKDPCLAYNKNSPYHPSVHYPEYPFETIGSSNSVYDSIRKLFFMLGMDKINHNTANWNPLGGIIKPGDTVLLKPNFVKHYNMGIDFASLVTQGDIIRAVLDYVYIALQGHGRIIIGDAPIQSCDFDMLLKLSGLNDIVDFYKSNTHIPVELSDLRLEKGFKDEHGIIKRHKATGDKAGYKAIDLEQESELFKIINDYEKFRVTNYEKDEMKNHHNPEKNEYVIANTFFQSDVVINLPKLKTHRKAGFTCALKNMVGINGTKDCLPHHRFGSREEGGDEYSYKSWRKRCKSKLNERRDSLTNIYQAKLLLFFHRLIRFTEIIFPYKDPFFEGNWYGNDTLPRVIADLNRIAFYADNEGTLKNTMQRKMFTIVDGIVAGEKEGPLHPSPKHCGLLVAGYNPVAVDLVCSAIMGFDYHKISKFKYCMHSKKYPLYSGSPDDIEILADRCSSFAEVYNVFGCNFIPSKGWKDHIEYNTGRQQ